MKLQIGFHVHLTRAIRQEPGFVLVRGSPRTLPVVTALNVDLRFASSIPVLLSLHHDYYVIVKSLYSSPKASVVHVECQTLNAAVNATNRNFIANNQCTSNTSLSDFQKQELQVQRRN